MVLSVQPCSSFNLAAWTRSLNSACMHAQAMCHTFQPCHSIVQLDIVPIFCFQCLKGSLFAPVFTTCGMLSLSPKWGYVRSVPVGSFSHLRFLTCGLGFPTRAPWTGQKGTYTISENVQLVCSPYVHFLLVYLLAYCLS